MNWGIVQCLFNGSSPSWKHFDITQENLTIFSQSNSRLSYFSPFLFVFFVVVFLSKELIITIHNEPKDKLSITCNSSCLCCCWRSYMLIDVYIVSRVICCRLWESREHSPHVTMYCMLNPLTSVGGSVHCDCTGFCSILIRKGQLFILISSSLKWCFNVIYISHWLFKLLHVFYSYLMGQNTELNIYIEYLISQPLTFYPMFQLLQVKRSVFFF